MTGDSTNNKVGSRGTGRRRPRTGRPENPVDPDAGPVERLAWDLRRLREGAGAPSYRALAKKAHYSASTLAEAAKGDRLPSLEVLLAYVRACGGDTEEWEVRWRAASAGQSADGAHGAADGSGRCPYPGPAAFETADAEVFFGRSELVKELSSSVERQPLTVLLGASGSGKTSLLRAGLLPDLGDRWRVALLTPGARPLSELAAAVSGLVGSDACDGAEYGPYAPAALGTYSRAGSGADRLRKGLAAEPGALDIAVRTWLAGQAEDVHVLIVIDQFEEVFTRCADTAERAAFLEAVGDFTRAAGARVRLVLGMRADFSARCFAHPGLAAALRAGVQLPVGPPTRQELREIITEPAARAGVRVEADLLQVVLGEADGQPGALALVAHAMREAWERRAGDALRLADHQASGGISGAVAQRAERMYHRAPRVQQDVIRAVFLRLTALGDGTEDTRRRLEPAELDGIAAPQTVQGVLRQLAAARLLVLCDGAVEVAHEAIIRSWPRLARWLNEDREALRTHRRLTGAARAWHELGRDADALYRGTQLVLARRLARDHGQRYGLNRLEADFLSAGIRAAHRRRWHAYLIPKALACLLVFAAASLVTAWQQRLDATEQHRLAVSRQRAAQSAELLQQRPQAAALVALDGYRQARTVEARGSLLSAFAQCRANRLTGHRGRVTAVAYAPDGRTVATAGADRAVRVWDAVRNRLRATLTGHTAAVGTAVFSPDGRTLATGGEDRTVRLWDLVSRRTTAVLRGHQGAVTTAAFAPDGRTLATGSADGTTRLWSPAAGRALRSLAAHRGRVTAVAYAPDGRTLATAGADRAVRVWDAVTHRVRTTLTGHAAHALAFSPDGRTVATVGKGGAVRLWDLASRRVVTTLGGHSRTVVAVAFSPDGHTLATGGYDRTVRLWDLPERRPKAVLSGHTDAVTSVSFSPDGSGLATGSGDGSARLWDTDANRIADRLCTLNRSGDWGRLVRDLPAMAPCG